jgi:hypothetical protein
MNVTDLILQAATAELPSAAELTGATVSSVATHTGYATLQLQLSSGASKEVCVVAPEMAFTINLVITDRAETEESLATCKHCGHQVADVGDHWVHWVDGKQSNVGCRAASFDRLDGRGWDEALDKHWKAQPA